MLGAPPFANNSTEADAPLAAGIGDVPIATLGSTRGLTVLSKSATDEAGLPRGEPRRSPGALARPICSKADCSALAAISTISVTLSRGDSGLIAWSQSFPAPEKDIFTLQQRISDAVRRAVPLTPSAAVEEQRLKRGGPTT